MSTQAQIDANKRNCLRSTGPTSARGRSKSSMNALKHGTRSARVKLIRDHSLTSEQRRIKWMSLSDASNDMEEFVAAQNATLSLKLERLERAEDEQYTSRHEKIEEDELDSVDDLGSSLFLDHCGPTALYGTTRGSSKTVRTSWDPKDAAEIDRIRSSRNCFRARPGASFCWTNGRS